MHQATNPAITGTASRDSGSRKGKITVIDSIICYVCPQGGLSANEFYKKNNRWSEGLISAAKAVGWGASILV